MDKLSKEQRGEIREHWEKIYGEGNPYEPISIYEIRRIADEVDKIQPELHVVDKLILAAMHLKECEGRPGDDEQAECDVEELRNRVIAMIPRPIPVSERLPEDGQQVMAYDESNPNSSPQYKWQGSIFEHGSFFGDWSRWDTPLDNVTHWLPMPPTPEV